MSGHQPPHGVNAKESAGVLIKCTLSSILFLKLVDVALIFVHTLKLFSENLICEESEEDAFHKSYNAHNEGNRVA